MTVTLLKPCTNFRYVKRGGGNASDIPRTVCCSSRRPSTQVEQSTVNGVGKFCCGILAGALTGSLLFGNPAFADIAETVPASSVTEYAAPLPAQKVEKGKVWLIFILGASTLFGATIILENNEKFFPAISKANRAMKVAQRREESEEQQVIEEASTVAIESTPQEPPSLSMEDARLIGAVQEGLSQARRSEFTENIPEKSENIKKISPPSTSSDHSDQADQDDPPPAKNEEKLNSENEAENKKGYVVLDDSDDSGLVSLGGPGGGEGDCQGKE